MKILLLISLIFVGISACSKDDSKTSAKASPEETRGASIVKANCKVCHAQGLNGAPVIGNKKMWGPRLEKGIPQLITNASNGVGLMPAKGGNIDLTDEEISLAVNYLVKQVK